MLSFLEINEELGIIHLYNAERKSIGTLGLHHARIIASNIKAGKPYYCASPIWEMSRTEMSLFHVHADAIISTKPLRAH